MTETLESMRVGDWLIEPELLRISRGDEARHVEPKVMDLLVLLADRAPAVVSRDEIFAVVWEGRAVVDATLSRAVSLLRRALDDDTRAPRYVETIATRGYRLIAAVEREAPELIEAIEVSSTAAAPRSGGRPPAARWALPATLAAIAVAIIVAVGLQRGRAGREVGHGVERRARSLAVLPFEDLSGEAADPSFAAGLTEALITRLARLDDLRVISPTSVETFRGSDRAPTDIARDLGVEAVLEGSVIQRGERVRVSARLIDAASGAYLWAQEYDRQLSDILHLHATVAGAVAGAVRLRLTPRERSALARSSAVDSQAYRHYLRGRFHWNRRTIPDLEQSVGHFERALEIDARFAPAHAGLADAWVLLSTYYALRPDQAFPPARSAAERALELDPLLPEAWASLGAVRLSLDWDFPGAAEAYRRALELGPGYATAHQWYGELLSVLGRHDEAVAQGQRALQLDPLSPIINAALGQRLNAAGRWEEALEQLGHTLELEPRFAWIRREMAYAETHLGRPDRSVVERLREMEARGIDEEDLDRLRHAVRTAGTEGFWRWELDRLEQRARRGFIPAMLLAEASEGTGDRERALAHFEAAVAQKGDHVLQLSTSPELMRLARDRRAGPLLVRAGLGHLAADPPRASSRQSTVRSQASVSPCSKPSANRVWVKRTTAAPAASKPSMSRPGTPIARSAVPSTPV